MIWSAMIAATIAVALACLLLAAVFDVARRIIPNELVLAVTVLGITLRILTNPGALWMSVGIAALTIALLGVLAVRSMFGWGDVKMIAAVTLLVPPTGAFALILAIAIAGGLLACAYLLAGRTLRQSLPAAGPSRQGLAGLFDAECTRIRTSRSLPYGVAVFGGVAYQTTVEAVRCWSAISCWQ